MGMGLMELVFCKEVSLGDDSPRGPSARVPIRLQYPVFKVPGGVSAPAAAFLSGRGARRYFTFAPRFRQDLFSKFLEEVFRGLLPPE